MDFDNDPRGGSSARNLTTSENRRFEKIKQFLPLLQQDNEYGRCWRAMFLAGTIANELGIPNSTVHNLIKIARNLESCLRNRGENDTANLQGSTIKNLDNTHVELSRKALEKPRKNSRKSIDDVIKWLEGKEIGSEIREADIEKLLKSWGLQKYGSAKAILKQLFDGGVIGYSRLDIGDRIYKLMTHHYNATMHDSLLIRKVDALPYNQKLLKHEIPELRLSSGIVELAPSQAKWLMDELRITNVKMPAVAQKLSDAEDASRIKGDGNRDWNTGIMIAVAPVILPCHADPACLLHQAATDIHWDDARCYYGMVYLDGSSSSFVDYLKSQTPTGARHELNELISRAAKMVSSEKRQRYQIVVSYSKISNS